MRIADALTDESAQTLVKIRPELVSGWAGCAYWHPQPVERDPSPQHSALSDGSQQVAWTSGAQQEPLSWLGGGAGLVSVCSFIVLL